MIERATVVFVRVVSKPQYQEGEQRLLDSYLKFDAGFPHNLVIIDRHGDSPDNVRATHLRLDSDGWDCGAWKFAASELAESEFLMCFNSSTVIQGPGWLKRFIEVANQHGNGIYGPLASHEIVPHIRTPCMAFQPEVVNGFPQEVNTREDTYRYESCGYPDGTPNVTQWARSHGYATRLVTWSGDFDQPQWKQPNVFRQGDQSDLIVWDRHCEAYKASDAAGKAQLEHLAYGNMRL